MSAMSQAVLITFECMPQRMIGRLDVPIDASPKHRALCERIVRAIETHGSFNTYYLYNARCVFQLTNSDEIGMLQFAFEGTALTDPEDRKTVRCDLTVELARETCDWLTEPVVQWFTETVPRSVAVEFDRYIAAGDLAQAIKRIEAIQARSDQSGGFVGMYL
jgi:hypothetical protein